MSNLLLVFVVSTWLCAATPAGAASRNHEAVYAKGQAKLVEVMKIGGGDDEGDDPPPFYQPTDIEVAKNGDIYVLESRTSEVVVFERGGKFRFRFSREGQGPGELSGAYKISIDRRGRVIVYEFGNRRFSMFSAAGKYIDSSRFEDAMDFQCMRDGRILTLLERSTFSYSNDDTHVSLAILDSTFTVTAVLDSMTIDKFVVVSTKDGMSTYSQPFFDALIWRYGPDGGVYCSRRSKYSVQVFNDLLSPVRKIERDTPPVKVTAEDRKLPKEWPAYVAAKLAFPAHKPPLDGLYCDNHGYLLVDRAVPSKAPALLDVYRPDGTFVGEVSIPDFRPNAVFDGDTILMLVYSKEELPAVIRYRLE